ncbi:hypothetical protein DFH08DRAFT_973205 [Mycena albidolilacea]|uniref:Uncharacterized protein n=1 Tax=Mycena albidolilacea TaxID=1033008 RepID=A0AAD6Z9S3_9AGAR|nr:hypothetical protein DFH08DRAFT_973205 [Mycena albidolilacea]
MVAIDMSRMLQFAAVVLLSASVAEEHEGSAFRIQPGNGACLVPYHDDDIVAAVPAQFFAEYNAEHGTPQNQLPICNKYVVVTNEANGHTVTARIVDDFDDSKPTSHIIGFPSAPMGKLGNGNVVDFIEKLHKPLLRVREEDRPFAALPSLAALGGSPKPGRSGRHAKASFTLSTLSLSPPLPPAT